MRRLRASLVWLRDTLGLPAIAGRDDVAGMDLDFGIVMPSDQLGVTASLSPAAMAMVAGLGISVTFSVYRGE